MDDENPDLKNQLTDYIVTTAKITLGAVPVVGSALAELVCVAIPNQRIDRIAKFAEMLHSKLSEHNEELIRSQLTNENFTEFLEESLMQVIRSTTDERREYIASIVANGISPEQNEIIRMRHFLRILSEINDQEIIWLRFYLVASIGVGVDEEFRQKHEATLNIPPAYIGVPDDPSNEEHVLKESYREHLAQLGLLERNYKVDTKSKQPIIGIGNDGQLKIANYAITPLGRSLLKYIGLSEDGFLPTPLKQPLEGEIR